MASHQVELESSGKPLSACVCSCSYHNGEGSRGRRRLQGGAIWAEIRSCDTMDKLMSSYVSMDGESGMEQSTEPLVRRGRGARGRDGGRRG